MCPPDHFGIEYEINPWMSRSRGADSSLAHRQWNNLRDAFVKLGVKVELMEPIKGLPDLVFTANAGLVFKDHGWKTESLGAEQFFEGAGDALFCGPILFAGYRFRSDALAHQEVGRRIVKQVLPLELVDPRYYHLDTCFCPLVPGAALYYPPAFDAYGRKVLEMNIPKLIAVNDHDAQRFGCNAVVVGKTVVTNSDCEALWQELKSAGFATVGVELDEFLKSGGSAKCLTIRLDGEEAAVWD